MINLYWIASIWRQNEQKWWVTSQNIQNYAKLRKWSNYNELHRFDVKTIYNDELRRKTTKVINLYWIASIWRQNDLKCWVTSQTIQTAKLQKWSTYTELHRFDVKTSKNDELRRKTFKTTQNYESDQIIMNCIDLTSKRSKMLSYVANHSKPLNYKSDQLILNCIDLTSKRSKMLSYVAKHSKQRWTTKVI